MTARRAAGRNQSTHRPRCTDCGCVVPPDERDEFSRTGLCALCADERDGIGLMTDGELDAYACAHSIGAPAGQVVAG